MKQWMKDKWFMSWFIIAHLLLFFTFQDKAIFWYIFSASMLVLISLSLAKESIDNSVSIWNTVLIGSASGVLLFSFFWVGNHLFNFFDLPLTRQVTALYKWYAPKETWHYFVLMLIIAPGEEIFWRGYIQKRLLVYSRSWMSIPISALMYASAHLYADYWMLAFSALFAGVFWGWLYWWKRSLPLVIVSHLIYDFFLFITLPLR